MSNLDDVLRRLGEFWSAHGCSEIWPCGFEIPASTLHPEMFARLVRDPQSRVFCRQPISRPGDGRGALHANRLARHLQFSVLFKPPPEDVPGLVMRSLEAAGFELASHDVRFAEWNWALHSLDAWGVGWRLELDGLGVARITYVQQAAAAPLDGVALEVCYGVERLVQALVGARSVLTLGWDRHGSSYSEQRRDEEVEHSRYAQEIAEPEALRQIFDRLCSEARRCLEAGAGRRAYELAAQSLVWVDHLDARGELQRDDRRQALDTLRQLIVNATGLWLRDRHPDERPAGATPEPPSATEQPATPEPVSPLEPAATGEVAEVEEIDEVAATEDVMAGDVAGGVESENLDRAVEVPESRESPQPERAPTGGRPGRQTANLDAAAEEPAGKEAATKARRSRRRRPKAAAKAAGTGSAEAAEKATTPTSATETRPPRKRGTSAKGRTTKPAKGAKTAKRAKTTKPAKSTKAAKSARSTKAGAGKGAEIKAKKKPAAAHPARRKTSREPPVKPGAEEQDG